jgi:hypothetical protein
MYSGAKVKVRDFIVKPHMPIPRNDKLGKFQVFETVNLVVKEHYPDMK